MSKKELLEKLLKEYKDYAIELDGLVQKVDIIIAELETKLSCTDEV